MKVYKRNVVVALLLTFAFFIAHDFFVKDIQVFNQNIVHNEVDIKKDIKIHLHESMHSIYNNNLEQKQLIEGKLVDIKPSNKLFSITSNITKVPQKPPSV